MASPEPAQDRLVWFITHPDVLIDPAVPVPEWALAPRGIDRMHAMLVQPWVPHLDAIWCSTERKARDGGEILARHLRLVPRALHELGEMDRSSTGYQPRFAFEALAEAFFANPEQSVQGWERAVDAQQRIVAAIAKVIASETAHHRIAIVSHGGVGALLLAHLLGQPISRSHDQPPGTGGHYFCFDGAAGQLRHAWKRIDEVE